MLVWIAALLFVKTAALIGDCSSQRGIRTLIRFGKLYLAKRNCAVIQCDHAPIVDISQNEIEHIGHELSFGNPTSIYAHGNLIKTVADDTFQTCENLRHLILANNFISSLHKDLFVKCFNVTQIDLRNNRLSELHLNFLLPMKNLVYLNLMDNPLISFPRIRRSDSNLIQLNLEGTNIEIIGRRQFSGRNNLKHLSLNSMKLSYISDHDFTLLVNLTNLYLRKNLIEKIHYRSFQTQHNLIVLDLSGNKLKLLADFVFITLSSLRTLHLENNSIEAITDGTLIGMDNLEYLYLGNNKIRTMSVKSTQMLKNLKLLSIVNNNMEDLQLDLQTLQFLYISGNKFVQFSAQYLKNLELLEINENNGTFELQSLPESLQKLSLQDSTVDLSVIDFKPIENLKTLLLRGLIDNSVFAHLIHPAAILSDLDISKRRLTKQYRNKFRQVNNLLNLSTTNVVVDKSNDVDQLATFCPATVLDLSYNVIRSVPSKYFHGFVNLETLIMRYCQIHFFPADFLQSSSQYFSLNLEGNPILLLIGDFNFGENMTLSLFLDKHPFRTLDEDSIWNRSEKFISAASNKSKERFLTNLHLSNGLLRTIERNTFEHMPRLSSIVLKNNILSTISPNSFVEHSTSMEHLDLSNNPRLNGQSAALYKKCPNLKYLNLALTGLSTFVMRDHMEYITTLNLSSNSLRNFDPAISPRVMARLENLDISSNSMTRIILNKFTILQKMNSLKNPLNYAILRSDHFADFNISEEMIMYVRFVADQCVQSQSFLEKNCCAKQILSYATYTNHQNQIFNSTYEGCRGCISMKALCKNHFQLLSNYIAYEIMTSEEREVACDKINDYQAAKILHPLKWSQDI